MRGNKCCGMREPLIETGLPRVDRSQQRLGLQEQLAIHVLELLYLH